MEARPFFKVPAQDFLFYFRIISYYNSQQLLFKPVNNGIHQRTAVSEDISVEKQLIIKDKAILIIEDDNLNGPASRPQMWDKTIEFRFPEIAIHSLFYFPHFFTSPTIQHTHTYIYTQ